MNEIVDIREGNDFALVWEIIRNGQPEDLSLATNTKLTARIHNDIKVLEFERVDTNKIRVEFTPQICRSRGVYNLQFSYTIPDLGFIDGKRDCAVDKNAFRIVSSTAEASDPSEFTVPGEMAIAFKGDKGDSSYEVWLETHEGTLEDYEAWIRKPATDAIQGITELEATARENEDNRIEAETAREQAESVRDENETYRITAEGIRNKNEGFRIEAEILRSQKETERQQTESQRLQTETDRQVAEILRVQKETERQQTESQRLQTETDRQEAETERQRAETKRREAEIKRHEDMQEAIADAEASTERANEAADRVLSNIVHLEIRDDMSLYMITPDNYQGITFKIENSNLVAIIP